MHHNTIKKRNRKNFRGYAFLYTFIQLTQYAVGREQIVPDQS